MLPFCSLVSYPAAALGLLDLPSPLTHLADLELFLKTQHRML